MFCSFRLNPSYPFFCMKPGVDLMTSILEMFCFFVKILSVFSMVLLIAAHLQLFPGGRAEAEQSCEEGV